MIFRGKQIEVLPTPKGVNFLERLTFFPGQKGTSKQIVPWAGLIGHWTGGEGASPTVIKTLKERDLSVHFIIDVDGTVIQVADLNSRCSHASGANDRFIGVEMVCRGFATKFDLAKALLKDPDLRTRDAIDWSVDRDVYADEIGRDRVHMASFNPCQIDAFVWLAEALAKQFGFPRRIPSARCILPTKEALAKHPLKNPLDYLVLHEEILWLPSFDRDVVWRPRNFKGVMAHFHVSSVKMDFGTAPLWKLWELGWNPAEVVLRID